MTKVSISEAIRMAGVSRSHFYNKYINKGLLSVQIEDDKKLIDVSELIRVFGNIQPENNIKEQNETTPHTANTHDKDRIIELLEQQIHDFREREKEAKDREEWLQEQINNLHQVQNNLLEDKTKRRKKILGIF